MFTDVVRLVTLPCTESTFALIVLTEVVRLVTLPCTESTLALIVLTDVVRLVTLPCTVFTVEARATTLPPIDKVLAVASKINPLLLEVILPLAIIPFLTLKSF